jgi:formate dehydrogenase iron-sulfur subunit
VAQLRAKGLTEAVLYDPTGVGGTGVVTVLAHGDHPEWYGLPAAPRVPVAVRVWKAVLRPFGLIAIVGSVLAAVAHFMSEGPKEVRETGDEGGP